MSTFRTFLQAQNEIYERQFRPPGSDLPWSETTVDQNVAMRFGGYAIILRHPPEVAATIAQAARRIAGVSPALAYTRDMVHTTISSFGAADFVFDPEDPAHVAVLALLEDGVQRALRMFRMNDRCGVIRYPPPAYRVNAGAVIAAGQPDPWFGALVDAVRTGCRAAGREIPAPWGTHITVARFTVASSPLMPVAALLADAPAPMESVPIAIEVGAFAFTPDALTLRTFATFPL